MSNEIVKVESNQLAQFADMSPEALAALEAQLQQQAKDVAAREKAIAPSISLQGGRISIGGQQVEGNKLQAVILDHVLVKALYEHDYDPDNPRPPSCFALSREEKDLSPSDGGLKQVHPTCAGCPANEWGSGKGKGKACKDVRRLIIMAASDLTSPEAIKNAEVYKLELPPTSLKGWALYTKGVRDNFNRAPSGMVSEIGAVPVKTYFHVTFKAMNVLPVQVMPYILEKAKTIQDQLWAEWDKAPEVAEDEAPKKKQKF